MKNAMSGVALMLSVSICAIGGVQTQRGVTIPAGAAIRVRTIDPIDVDSAAPGSRFRGNLADPVMSRDGAILIPRGAPVELSAVRVSRAGRIRGRDRIDLKVDSITFNGKRYTTVTSISESKSGRRGSRTLGGAGIGAGAGALIGGLAGGGVGAGVGALVGGGGGTAVAAATDRKHLRIKPETVLSFQLESPLRVE
jgi:hypothetical protein